MTSISSGGIGSYKAALLLLEYLHYDAHLKGVDVNTPLNRDANRAVGGSTEDWEVARRDTIGDVKALSDDDKTAFINLFHLTYTDELIEALGIEDDSIHAGDTLRPEHLGGTVIETQILRNKDNEIDLLSAIQTINSSSLSQTSKQKFIAALLLLEYLQYDAYLKGVDVNTPLNRDASGAVAGSTEDWEVARRNTIGDVKALSDQDKTAFIELFHLTYTDELIEALGIEDDSIHAGDTLRPEHLGGSVIEEQILTQRDSIGDLFDAFCKLQIHTGAVCGVPAEVEDPDFALLDESLVVAYSATPQTAEEPTDWGYTWDKFIGRHPYVPDFEVRGSVGLDSPISLDRRPFGGADSDLSLTTTMGTGLTLDWARLQKGGYRLRPSAFVDYQYQGLFGADSSDKTENPDTHTVRTGVSFGFSPLNPGWIPDLALRYEFLHNGTDLGMLPNSDGDSHHISFEGNQQIYNFGEDKGRLTFDASERFSVGDRNGLGFRRSLTRSGLRYSLDSSFYPTFSVFGGYQFLYQEDDLSLGIFNRNSGYQVNTGHGGYLGLFMDFGSQGNFVLSGDYMDRVRFHDEASAGFRYTIPSLPWLRGADIVVGADYEMRDLTNGVSHEPTAFLGVQDVTLAGRRDGYGVFLDAGLHGGPQMVRGDSGSGLQDQMGGVVGGLVTVKWGRGSAPAREVEDVYRPVVTRRAEEQYRYAQVVSPDDRAVFSDPIVRSLMPGSRFIDAVAVANYLAAFKTGRLQADYSASGVSPFTFAEIDSRSSRAVAGDVVELGDVASTEFYIGETNPSELTGEAVADYERDVYRITPNKRRILGIASARQRVYFEELIAIDKPAEANTTANLLINSLKILRDLNLGTIPEGIDLEFDGQVAGIYMFQYAKSILKLIYAQVKGSALTTQEEQAIDRISGIPKNLVEVITAFAGTKREVSGQLLPTKGQLDEYIAAAPSQAQAAERPAPVVPEPEPADDGVAPNRGEAEDAATGELLGE